MEISPVKEIAPLGYYTPATRPRSPPPPPDEGFDLEPRWLLAFSTLIPPPFSVISQKVEMIPIKFTNGPLKGRAACDGGPGGG